MIKINKEQQANIKGGDRCDRLEGRINRYDPDSWRYARTVAKYFALCGLPEVN